MLCSALPAVIPAAIPALVAAAIFSLRAAPLAAQTAEPRASVVEEEESEEDEEPTFAIGVYLDAQSRYVWQGMPWSQDPIATGTVEFEAGPCSVGGILYQAFTAADAAPEPIEVDAFGQCTFDVGLGFTVAPKAEYWRFPSYPGGWPVGYFATEVGWSLNEFTLSTEQAYMVGSAPRAYFGQVSLGWAEAFGPVEVGVTSRFTWGNAAYFDAMVDVSKGGANHVELAVDATWDLGSGLALYGGTTVSKLFDSEIQAAAGANVLAVGRLGVQFYTGL